MKRSEIRKSVRLAISNIMLEGCTDVTLFKKPFEIDLLRNKSFYDKIVNDVVAILDNIINHNGKFDDLKINKIDHMLVPKKNNFDFRKCALIDILDEIKYLSLVCLIASEIEKNRLDKKTVFSYRFKPNEKGGLFERKYNYSAFKARYKQLSANRKYKIIIECDISNFYDRLNIHRLNSTLLSISSIDEKISDTIDKLLLFWANRDSYGIPVGSNASRILAEAFLLEIDNYLISNDIKFCRFVDDYRFFAKDSNEANRIITMFVHILNKHGLSINLSKTNFRDISQYTKATPKSNIHSKEGLFEIIRGYSGLVPTKFRKLSNSEINKYINEDEEEIMNRLKKDMIIKPEDITKAIRIIVAKQKFKLFLDFPEILKKYPQFIPYYSDVVVKYKDYIGQEIFYKIINKFDEWLKDYNVPEYILISIINLFDCSNENEKKVLFTLFKNLKRNSGIYIGRALLEQIGFNLTRGEILEIKDFYLRSDSFEKRQMIRIILNGLSKNENRPFIKDLRINCNDPFVIQILNEYESRKDIR